MFSALIIKGLLLVVISALGVDKRHPKMKPFGGFIRLKRQAAKVSYFFISQEKIRFLTKTSKKEWVSTFCSIFLFFLSLLSGKTKNPLTENRNFNAIFTEKNEDSYVHGFSNFWFVSQTKNWIKYRYIFQKWSKIDWFY